MIGYFSYFNVVQGREIINDSRNPRMDLYENQVLRGSILDKDGNVLAESVEMKTAPRREPIRTKSFLPMSSDIRTKERPVWSPRRISSFRLQMFRSDKASE